MGKLSHKEIRKISGETKSRTDVKKTLRKRSQHQIRKISGKTKS